MWQRLKQIRAFTFGLWATYVGALFLLLSPVAVQAIARGYTTTDAGLETGMVVVLSLDPSVTNTVERATQDNNNRVIGIVTTIDNSFVTVGSSSSKVLVESEGQVNAYVSDIGGAVHKGDLLVVSPLKGILMKNNPNVPAVVIAIASETPENTTSYSYNDNGKTKQTEIANVKVNLNHPGGGSGISQSDSSLARIGRSLVGRQVGETRVVVAMILFFIVLIAEGGILYGAISSAITALGRNPLARKIIRKELLRVVIIAVLVLAFGVAAVYGILWA